MPVEQRHFCDCDGCDNCIEEGQGVLVYAFARIPNSVQDKVREETPPGTPRTMEVTMPPSVYEMLHNQGARKLYCAECWAETIGEELETRTIQLP